MKKQMKWNENIYYFDCCKIYCTIKTDVIDVYHNAEDGDPDSMFVYYSSQPLGSILNNEGEEADAIRAGHCPICESWEDGNGNTCTLYGWE